MTVHPRIEMRPDVMLGKPVIRGTRITVALVLRKLAERATLEDVLDRYPRITREDVHAAIQFAADTLAAEPVPLVHGVPDGYLPWRPLPPGPGYGRVSAQLRET